MGRTELVRKDMQHIYRNAVGKKPVPRCFYEREVGKGRKQQ
jgi:hypothetical protein